MSIYRYIYPSQEIKEVLRNAPAIRAEAVLVQAATSNFTGLTADQVGDLVKGLGDDYSEFKPIFVRKGLSGAVVAQSMDDIELFDYLKEVGVTSKLQQKAIEIKFKSFYHPKTAAVAAAPVAAPAVATTEVPDSSTKVEPKHIMMSYCWAEDANPAHVKALADYLRSKYGYDVWQDTDGSTICGKMSGGTDEKMAEAVSKSAYVIICVSKAYPGRPNCEQEAKFARQKEKAKSLEIIYVMLQEEYTTVCVPKVMEEWLAMYIGDKLWYPLWDINQLASTGNDFFDEMPALPHIILSVVTSSVVIHPHLLL